MTPELQKKLRQAMLKAGYLLQEAAYDLAPEDTTDLKRSIIVQSEGPLEVAVGPTMEYGIYVHEGTGIHGPKHKQIVIKAKKKKALKFKFNGQDVIVKKVVQDGIKPNPYMDNAWEEIQDEAEEMILDEAGEASLEELGLKIGKTTSW